MAVQSHANEPVQTPPSTPVMSRIVFSTPVGRTSSPNSPITFITRHVDSYAEKNTLEVIILTCVHSQTLTPHNKGLIKRAISQSGVSLCPWAIIKNPRKMAEEVHIAPFCHFCFSGCKIVTE